MSYAKGCLIGEKINKGGKNYIRIILADSTRENRPLDEYNHLPGLELNHNAKAPLNDQGWPMVRGVLDGVDVLVEMDSTGFMPLRIHRELTPKS